MDVDAQATRNSSQHTFFQSFTEAILIDRLDHAMVSCGMLPSEILTLTPYQQQVVLLRARLQCS